MHRALTCAGIPVLVEAETVRPFLEDLLGLATYVSTSAAFPQVLTHDTAQVSSNRTRCDAGLADLEVACCHEFPACTLPTVDHFCASMCLP